MNVATRCFSCKSTVFLLFILTLLVTGCAKDIQLSVVAPAQIDTRGIKKVAVGRFEVARIHYLSKLERNGEWQQQSHILTTEQKNALSNQIRARIISSLATVPYFDLVYTDEFAELENDAALQDAIAAKGFRTADVDAVINGKIWLDVIQTDGVDIDKSKLEFHQGGREGTFNYDLEVLVYWPYKSVNGTLALELKLTRLNPTEVLAVTFDERGYSKTIGGKPENVIDQIETETQGLGSTIIASNSNQNSTNQIEESDLVLPNFEQLVADLAESISTQFVRRVSLTQKALNYRLASGGNPTARLLIEAGAYEKAIAVLTETLNQAGEKDPANQYNLGVCFEATGDYGLAAVSYADAVSLKPGDLLYAQGIGRIERLKRESIKLRQQLSAK